MSKVSHKNSAPVIRFGEWLRELRVKRDLPLRVVAEAAKMDLAHLQKIELSQRLPTEEQAAHLAKFFRLDETETQARRIVEKFRHEFAEHPAATEAIQILAEEAGVYSTGRKNGRNNGKLRHPKNFHRIHAMRKEIDT